MTSLWLPWTTDARKVVSTSRERHRIPGDYFLETINDTTFLCYCPSYGLVAEAESNLPSQPGQIPSLPGYWRVKVWRMNTAIGNGLLPLAYAVYRAENPQPHYFFGLAAPQGAWRDQVLVVDEMYAKDIAPGGEVLSDLLDALRSRRDKEEVYS